MVKKSLQITIFGFFSNSEKVAKLRNLATNFLKKHWPSWQLESERLLELQWLSKNKSHQNKESMMFPKTCQILFIHPTLAFFHPSVLDLKYIFAIGLQRFFYIFGYNAKRVTIPNTAEAPAIRAATVAAVGTRAQLPADEL